MKYKILLFLWITVNLMACKSTPKTKSSTGNQEYKQDNPNRINSVYQKLEKEYQKYKGVKYRYGGTTSLGFDCSGFVQRVYKNAFQIDLPRTTRAMMKTGKRVNKSELKSGDLVFFHPTRNYYHVGIYMEKGIFIHASSSKGVIKSKLNMKYWKKSFVMAKRIL